MAMQMVTSCIHFGLLILVVISLHHTISLASKKTYIVYLGMHQHGPNPTELDAGLATQSHFDYMASILGSYEKARESVLYNYKKYINGFVVKLTQDEVERIKRSSNVITVFENQRLKLSTTRSWEFLGLKQNTITPPPSTATDQLWNISKYGEDVIIGNIDSGVWPESESFKDEGFGQIPSRWRGACVTGSDPTFKCNKKLIGARYFRVEKNESTETEITLTPRDLIGHGTHTLSTAGGNFVRGVDVYGFGKGVAKGGSPKARVASYKVGWEDIGITAANVLAAYEAAIDDGVDVLSIQLNFRSEDYKTNPISIGTFHAVRHGITVVASAGNDGGFHPVQSTAPWIFLIGASTIDRDFYNEVYLGNSTLHFKGAYLGPNKLPRWRFYPLIDAASAVINSSTNDKTNNSCLEGSLDPSKIKGKIVVCDFGGKEPDIYQSKVVQDAGGVGLILINPEFLRDRLFAEPHLLPASHISYKDGQTILKYINSTKNPTAYITGLKVLTGVKPAPMMAKFSSKGPGVLNPYILKPDITAPGVDIIAAYTEARGPSDNQNDTRRVKYYVLSGTSMSAPHVAGVVSLIKSVHPKWSPAAIRSAIMTTATTLANDNNPILDSNGQPATPFAYGAGHINPNAAANPGLIYNLTETDYLDFLCLLGSYDKNDLKLFTPIPYKCMKSKSILDFNYPSITVTNFSASSNISRIVTNVGSPGTYEAKVNAPSGINVTVIPSNMNFYRIGEEQTFTVQLKLIGEKPNQPEYVFGSLTWTDGIHSVRSPLVVQKI